MIFLGLVLLGLALGLGIGLSSSNEEIEINKEKCVDSKHGKCYQNGAVATDDARYVLIKPYLLTKTIDARQLAQICSKKVDPQLMQLSEHWHVKVFVTTIILELVVVPLWWFTTQLKTKKYDF